MSLSMKDKEIIKRHIVDRRGMKATPATQPVARKAIQKKSSSGGVATRFLAMVMFLLSFVIIGMMVLKTNGHFDNMANAQPQPYAQPYQEQNRIPETYPDDNYYEPEVVPDESVAELKTKVNRLSYKMWLLSLQANQNASLNKETDRQFHKGERADRYVYIQEDWKLDKKPDNIKFSDEDLERLQAHVIK